ncbi:MAG TPA: hypothetical protein VKC53_01575 [Patescibacteria group bacterium]|nr:hypothetical protein [Patescibacteria group bacterium]
MQKLTNFLSKNIFVVLILLLSIPTFYKMLQPGIYSMQDFHFFRLYEFDKCIQNLQIPCRWSPDAGLGYGEPLFNFYGQLPYAIGEIYHLVGGSIINSLKFLFILSLFGSSVSMFFLAKEIWKNNYSAFISSIIYLYAPYRAVDVWVRGALPEAFSFIFFPLILLSIEKKSYIWFSILLSGLILTHNLSLVMFLPILIIWIIYRRFWKSIPAGVVSFLISAFYILPVIFESKYVDLGSTITGYFDFRAHFVTLYQIFISRFWGYGGSTWGIGDGLSLSIGTIQWLLPLVILIAIVIRNKISKNMTFLTLFIVGIFYIFLTHNKSTFLWTHISGMAYIQFPWRFLGVATFCFALSSGAILQFFEKQKVLVSLIVAILAIVFNLSFFRGDIWYKVSDSYFTTGAEWTRQRTASIGDYWPQFGHKIPNLPGNGKYINYFPGWNNTPDENGLIPSSGASFKDTPIRKIGNIISLSTIIVAAIYVLKKKIWAERT